MTRERWRQLEALFNSALDRPAAERHEWLRRACEGDPDMLREARALLDAHATSGDFLEQPAFVADDLAAKDQAPHDEGAPAAGNVPRPRLSAGTRIGSYEILEELGRGGMGIVYLAIDHRLGRQVALKMLGDVAADQPAFRDRLRREARAAATITHPAVATVYALEEIEGYLFIVSEYVHGRTLRSEIEAGPIEAERVRSIAIDIVRGLCAAHEAGVIHRDLKPENVLVTEGGQVKVIDFGIAYIATPDVTRLTRDGAFLGTPAYMAPEQLVGATVDERTDVYAVGLLLAEMLTGQHPMHGGAPSTSTLGPFAGIVSRCMQAAPAGRFASAQDLLRALEGMHADPGTLPQTTAQWWWQFHQVTASIVYTAMIFPVWQARGSIGGVEGRVLFAAALTAAIVAVSIRLHLLFTSRFYASELRWARRQARWWIRAADWLFVASLLAAGALLEQRQSALAILLFSVAVGTTVAFLLIEPATTRAAFRRLTVAREASRLS